MATYQAFIDCFPGDNSLYATQYLHVDPSANTVTFTGAFTLTPDELPHEYRIILWENNVYVSYNVIKVLTVSRTGDPEEITLTYEVVRPLAL